MSQKKSDNPKKGDYKLIEVLILRNYSFFPLSFYFLKMKFAKGWPNNYLKFEKLLLVAMDCCHATILCVCFVCMFTMCVCVIFCS